MESLSLIVQDINIAKTYEKLVLPYNCKIENVITLDSNFTKIDSGFIIIDIKDAVSLKQLNNYLFKNDSNIILISPFLKNYISLPSSLNSSNVTYLAKPFTVNSFNIAFKNVLAAVIKIKYLKDKEKLLVKLVDESFLMLAIYDTNSSLKYANESYVKFNDINDLNNFKFENLKNCNVDFKDIIYNLTISDFYTLEKFKDSKYFKSFFYLVNSSQNIVHLCMDQTLEKSILENYKKSSKFFEKSNEAMIITDKNGKILLVNNAFCKVTGYTKDEALYRPINILKSGIQDKEFYINFWESLKIQGKWQGEIWNKRKNGEVYPEWLSVTEVFDYETKELNYMAIFTDITSLKDSHAKLNFYANFDQLTGLMNRNHFEQMLNQILISAARNKRKFALLFIDLDYFKDVNDSAGHDVGDLVLKEVARRFQKTLRKEDIIGRIGGDEFNIIIDNVNDESDVYLIANKLNDEIKKPFRINGKQFYLSLSVGIVIFPNHGLTSEELFKNADSTMYKVKESGRNGVLIYNKEITNDVLRKVALQNNLKLAVQKEDFHLNYQLVVDIHNNKFIGAEALIRWKNKKNEFVSPDEFIPIAENNGLIKDIGKIVLKQVCEDIPILLNKFGNDFTVAINISSKEFASDDFVIFLTKIVSDFNVSSSNIELEITETYIMNNHTTAIGKMNQLRELGFSLAIDDFGTGYSSLSYLKRFPVNKLKIDKSFVLNILNDEDDYDMVKAIINIAKIFDLEVQAEGVETLDHISILKDLKVDIAQGYVYCKPMPLEKILEEEWEL